MKTLTFAGYSSTAKYKNPEGGLWFYSGLLYYCLNRFIIYGCDDWGGGESPIAKIVSWN